MSNKLRFYGGKTITNTRTLTNQIGADVAGITPLRVAPTAAGFFNTIFVAKTGSNSNTGEPWSPKLTVQAACNVTSRGYTFDKATGVGGTTTINVTHNAVMPIKANEIAGMSIYVPSTGATYQCASNTADPSGQGAFVINLVGPIGTGFTNANVAVTALASYVGIKDSGVYYEIVDGNKKIIYSTVGSRPVIKMPTFNPEAYTADPGYVTAYNYYGNSESSLRGIAGVFFTGVIQDYKIIDGIHWIASTNGLWYSYLGYTGWYLVPGTAAQNWNDLVFNCGQLYARFTHAIPANNTVSTVTVSGVSTVLTQGAGATFKYLRGNADVMVLITIGAGLDDYYVWKDSAGVWTSTTVQHSLNVGGEVCLRTPFKYEGCYCFLYYYTGGNRLGGFMVAKDKAPAVDRFFNVSNTTLTGMETDSGYYDETNQVFYFSKTGGVSDLYKLSLGAITFSGYTFSVSLSATGMGYITKITDMGNTHYLHCYGGMYSTTDFVARTTITSVSNGQTSPNDQTPMAIFDCDIGRVILCNKWQAGRGLAMYIWKKFCIYNFNQLNGITIDGSNAASTGSYLSYTTLADQQVMWYCSVKNCLQVGILNGGQAAERSIVYNTIVSGCGVGVKQPDFQNGLISLYNCFIHDNTYGATGVGYTSISGPYIYRSVITRNTIKGVWYEKFGTAINPQWCYLAYSIVYGNGIDVVLKNRLAGSIYNNIGDNIIGSHDVDSSVLPSVIYNFSVNPLLLPNGDYKDTYGGYPYDSVAKTYFPSPVGLFDYTRSRVTAYTKDHHLTYLPVDEAINWKVSNFSSTENAFGEYSESFDGFSRTFNLTWNKDSMSSADDYYKIIDLWKDEDGVFAFGVSDGTNWVDQQSRTPTIAESDNDYVFTTILNHPTVGLNQYAGWYAEVYDSDSESLIYCRILSHNAGDGTVAITYQLENPYSGYYFIQEGTPMKVVYIPVKIDKSAGFNSSMYGYVNTPLTGYSLSLREVRYV